MKLVLTITIFLIILFVVDESQGWSWRRRRRRRRRTPPPAPEPNCIVSSWSSWSHCSVLCGTGTQTRDRHITYRPSPHCQEPSLHERRSCGAPNGGCEEFCDSNTGHCSCRTGFALASDGESCNDVDECQPNGGRGPCSHTCRNSQGSYSCSCPYGYHLKADQKTCQGRDCGSPVLPSCHVPVYSDHLGQACKKVTVSCPAGTRYNSQCHFSCPQNFALAKVTSAALPFAKVSSPSDFLNVIPSTTCGLNSMSVPAWSNFAAFKLYYYCRRTNDPPSDVKLTKTTIEEHSPIGTVVGSLSVVIPNAGDSIRYNLQQSAGEYFFQLRGNQLLNSWVPRWNNLQGLKINEYRIVIRATDEGNPPMWLDKSFNISVVNVNDPPYAIRISNNSVMDTAVLGHVIGVLSAVDYDGPRGSLRSSDFIWKLIDDDLGRFRLQGPQLVVAAALDHQAHRYHRIIVNCTDKDLSSPRWKTVSIVVNVINTNDSPKNIQFMPYRLYENATAGFPAGEFAAYDEDGDVMAFSISQSDAVTQQTFVLGQTSCSNSTINGIRHTYCKAKLLLKRRINYEVKNSYSVKVTASDPSGSFAIGDFTVHVVNLNEAPNDITLSSNTILENSPVGTFVGQLTISDPDTSQRSPQGHVCTVAPSKPFGINGVNLFVSEASLNFELISSYRITITCTDTGTPPLSFSKTFIITVQDRNERPEYLSLTRSSIREDARIGSVVGELQSRDPDLDRSPLTFHVKSPANSPFAIGGTGNRFLVTRYKLDYETIQKIEILISVTDNGGLSLEKYFNITIIDVNEAPTSITISPMTFPENSPPGAVIGTIRVNDPDFNSTASCRIISGDSQHLAISGLKLVAGSQRVDYEALTSMKYLQVTLRCSDEFNLYIDRSFHISVTDVNEPPSFIEIIPRSIPENKINELVGQLTVRDPDVNQKYTCKALYNGTESLLFTVDATLRLKTRRPLNFELQRQHLITIRCVDHMNANFSKFTVFKDIGLSVLDLNEAPLNPCPNQIYVDEAASDGYVVWTFKPYDPDNEKNETEKRLGLTSSNQKQQLSIRNLVPSFPFQIVDDRYLVKRGVLDRSVKDVYDLALNVSDDGVLLRLTNKVYQKYQGPIISSYYTCKIRILASGDHRLFLDIALSSNSIPEDALNGTKVGTFSVINPRPGQTYTLSLVQANAVPFKIVGRDLILITGVPLDYETTNSTAIGVLISDSNGTTSQKMFEIRITNVNERPIKMCLIGNKTVMELTNSDQIVGKIFIEDEDHKQSKGICESSSPTLDQSKIYSCRIESNVIDVTSLKQDFYIDKNLVLHGHTIFDFSARSQYLVPLMCTDKSKPIHTIELSVTIRVKDSTARPKWDFTLSSKSVPEDAPNGTLIGQLSLVSGPSGSYTYRVADMRQPFRIVGTELVLVYSQPLDYETSNSTTIVIVSTNSEGISARKSFIITITNVNEKPVNLCLLDAISVIPEKSPANSVIGRLAIEDPDHPESKGICGKPSTGKPVQNSRYTCDIYSTTVNVDLIKQKFYVDGSYQLNRKSDFDYKTKNIYNIPIMCRDRDKPIHLIEKVFVVRIQAPSCQSSFKLVNGTCVCANGLAGPNCDRDLTICKKIICSPTEVCVSHINAKVRCIPRDNQVPILLQLPYSTTLPLEKRYKIEAYVESIFEGRRTPGQTLSSLFQSNAVSRRRREIPKDVYVEGASWQKVLTFFTYTVFVAMDPLSGYKALPGNKLCALLKGTDLRCVNEEDCALLKRAGIDCPYVFGSNGTKGESKGGSSSSATMPVVYGVLSVCVALAAIFVLYIIMKRKRKRKSDQPVYFHDIQSGSERGRENPTYDVGPQDYSPQIPPHNAEKSQILRNNLANPSSDKKQEIKTFKNKLYKIGKDDMNNPLYDAMSHPPPPPPRKNNPLYESIGQRLGKDTVNSMLDEEKVKAREKGFEEDAVALPKREKGKWMEPDYATVDKLQKKQNNLQYAEIAEEKAAMKKKKLEGDVVQLPVEKDKVRYQAPAARYRERQRHNDNYVQDDKKKAKKKDSTC